jgi:fatty acid desaturase
MSSNDISMKSLNALTELSDRRGALMVSSNWAAIIAIASSSHVLTEYYGVVPSWTRIIAAILIATRLGALESCTHQATHFTLFRRRALNDKLDLLFSIPICECVQDYRRAHRLHHQRFGSAADPAFALYRQTGLDDASSALGWKLIVAPLLGFHTFRFVRDKLNLATRSALWACKYFLFLASLVAFFSYMHLLWDFLWYYLIPLFVILPIFLFWSEAFDHLGLQKQPTIKSSRNISSKLLSFFLYPHSEGFHLVHHLHPGVPTYRLREAHAILLGSPAYRDHGQTVHSLAELVTAVRRTSN